MKKRGLSTLFALSVGFALVLSGCGGNNNQNNSAPANTASASQPASTEAPVQSPEPTKGLEGKIVYWSMWNENEAQAKVIKEAAAAIEAANPGTKISIQWSGRDLQKLIRPALEAGQQIDVFDANGDSLIGLEDHTMVLDDYFSQTFPSTEGKTLGEAVLPAFLKSMRDASGDGKVHAMPYQPFIYSVYYNKALFDKAGITGTPKTWSEFLDVAEKLKTAGITPITIDDAYMFAPRILHFSRYLGQEGVAKLVLDKTGAEWDNPLVLKAAKDYEDLNTKGYFSKQVLTNKFPAGQMEFASGKAAIYLTNGSWFPNEIANAAGPDFRFGQFAYPAVDGGVMGTEAAMYGTQSMAINKNTKNADLALTFAVSLVTGEFDEKLSQETKGIAMGTDSEWPKEIADSKQIFAQVTTNLVRDGGWKVDGSGDKPDLVHSNFVKLLTGKITAEEFVKNSKENKQ